MRPILPAPILPAPILLAPILLAPILLATILLAVLICLASPCQADIGRMAAFAVPESQLCRAAIAQVAPRAALPPHLLAAIARVESGRRDARSGAVGPWPWTVNAEGEGFFFDTKAQAIAAVRDMQARGMRSIDIGCLQVNLMHHPDAFASLEAAFDPATNAAYAAKFLNQLQAQTGSWQKATAMYHSADPERGAAYQHKVAAAVPDEQRNGGVPGQAFPGQAFPGQAFPGQAFPGQTFPGQGLASGGFLAPQRAVTAHIIPLPAGTAGRGLDAYRSVPIAMISRIRRFGG